jgi:phosphonate transport system substrate-binding protein
MAMGAVGYVEAKRLNPKIDVLFVNADKNGKLDDAKYFSWICVNKADADKYMNGGVYSIDNVKGKSISFVTNSSTSGFSVPTDLIIAQFPADNLDKEKLGKAGFFKEVVFGQSHQGAAYNLVNGNVDVAAFCDTELATFIELKSGTESTVGAVYAVKQNAAAPFDKLGGKEFVLLAVAPVFNGPNAYNPKNLTKDEVKAIQDLFTSAAVTNNRKIFYDKAIDPQASGLYDISKSNGYVLVDDSWYNAYR